MILSRIWQSLPSTSCAAATQLQQALCDGGGGCQPHATGIAGEFAAPHVEEMAVPEQLCDVSRFSTLDIQGASILSITTTQNTNYTFPTAPELGFRAEPFPPLNFCNVSITYTHPGWSDEIHVTVYLPVEAWNGRFQATGGGGFVTGGEAMASFYMAPGLLDGYSVATTDGGHSDSLEASMDVSPWALSSAGNVNWPLVVDFAKVALHDMAAFGKAVTTAYYGVPPHHSYFHGGSTGGRQGIMFAQSYPRDFDGIVAICPAINWAEFIMANYWPQYIMNTLKTYPRGCEIQAITDAAITVCDKLDGVEDGIISLPGLCDFNPETLVGKSFDCAGEPAIFTRAAAAVVNAAWGGPRSAAGKWQWFGVGKDADLGVKSFGIARTRCITADDDDDDGMIKPACTGEPFPIATAWMQYFLARDPSLDLTILTHSDWDTLFHTSLDTYQSILGTANADLSEFRAAGGKMLSWHGMRDAVIPVNGSARYYDRVLAEDPDAHEFFRLFLVPGAGHGLEDGPTPRDMMGEIVRWVEEGVAPETLRGVGEDGRGVGVQRDLCAYPRVQVYVDGDPRVPSSFTCI
ncbi:Tannase/feruloyl esterase [Aspergillus insuetus]